MTFQKKQPDQVSTGKMCLTPKCENKAQFRGLCSNCYGGAKKLIEVGQTTWVELEIMGMCASNGSLFIEAFKEKKKSELDSSVQTTIPDKGYTIPKTS